MRPAMARFMAMLIFGIAATSCSGSSGTSQPGTEPPTQTYLLPDVANPVNATVTVEPENAATATIGSSGGTLTATGSDGTVYTLTVPANALLDPVTITMTPIHSVAGVNFLTGRWVGARLAPEGLHFLAPVGFRMTPPEGERQDAFGFSAYGDGSELHGQPLTTDASRLEMMLDHFSDNGAELCGADCGGSVKAPMPSTPTDWEARLQNFLENEIRLAREGKVSDAELWSTIDAVLREYFTRVIEPMLPQLVTDCSFSEANLWRAIAFNHRIDILGRTSNFTTEEAAVQRAWMAAIENCFAQTAEPCIDQSNAEQMAKLYDYMRMYELLTSADPPFDANNPSLQCGRIWTGTSKVVFSATGDPSTSLVTMTASFVLEIDDAASTESIKIFHPKSGSVDWQSFAVDNSCTTTAGPLTFTLLPQDGTLTLFLSDTGATFEADGTLYRDGPAATYYTHCTDARGDSTYTGPAGGTWLSVPSDTPAFADGRGTMTGSISIPPYLSEWSFSR